MDNSIVAENDARILITGGGGYLGSRLAETISAGGAECYLLDRSFNETSSSLAARLSNVHLVSVDLNDKNKLLRVCRRIAPDHVFHLAASIDRTRDFGAFKGIWKINVGGTLNLLEALQEVPYKSFSFSSTSDVYGTINIPPFYEDQAPSPLTPYSLTKLMAENLITSWSYCNNKPFTIYRIFLFMGPDMPPTTFIGQLFDAMKNGKEFLMTEGFQKRDYLILDDLITCITTLAGQESVNREVINLCSGRSVSMKEIVYKVQENGAAAARGHCPRGRGRSWRAMEP